MNDNDSDNPPEPEAIFHNHRSASQHEGAAGSGREVTFGTSSGSIP